MNRDLVDRFKDKYQLPIQTLHVTRALYQDVPDSNSVSYFELEKGIFKELPSVCAAGGCLLLLFHLLFMLFDV